MIVIITRNINKNKIKNKIFNFWILSEIVIDNYFICTNIFNLKKF